MKKSKKITLLRDEVREMFGSYTKLAEALGITRQSIYNWSYRGLPLVQAFAISNLVKNKYSVEKLIENW